MLRARIKQMTSSVSVTSDTWGKCVRKKSTNAILVIFVMSNSKSVTLFSIFIQTPASTGASVRTWWVTTGATVSRATKGGIVKLTSTRKGLKVWFSNIQFINTKRPNFEPSLPPQCEDARCENGATCVDKVADYVCACLPGFTGKHCGWVLVFRSHFRTLKLISPVIERKSTSVCPTPAPTGPAVRTATMTMIASVL